MKRRRQLIARHVHWYEYGETHELRTTRVALEAPPVAIVSRVESIIHGWWKRSGGYPVGRPFHTATA